MANVIALGNLKIKPRKNDNTEVRIIYTMTAFDVYGYFQKTISLSFFLALMVTIGVNSVFDFGIWKFKSKINLLLLYDF